jgi:ABC-2 type transport system permease protein
MLRSVFTKTLRDAQRGILGWGLGLAGLVAMMVAVYPSVQDNPSLDQLLESYPDALKGIIGFGGELDYSSGAGYLGIELFSIMVPLLLIIAAVSAGSAAVAGEEERGTLDLLLSTPVSRRRLVLEKLGSLTVELLLLGAVLWVALVVGSWAGDLGVSAGHLGAATLSAVLLALGFGAIALLAGVARGRRGFAIAAAAAVAVAAYFVDTLSSLSGFLAAIEVVSPFYHYAAGDPLRHGLDALHVGFLVAVVVGAAALALVAVDRRDFRA